MSVWEDVISLVPPLEDLLNLCWAIPNQADLSMNIALNIALPEVYDLIQPYLDIPVQAMDMISQACDAAIELAYAPTPP